MVTSTEVAVSVLCVFIFNVLLFVARDLYRKRHILKFSSKFRGYNFYPIIGNGYHIIGQNFFSGVQKVIKKYKLPCNIWIGHDYNYVTADASEIKVILNSANTFDKSSVYTNIQIVFENTLLMADFETWKRNRKIFSKSFSQPILNSFVEVIYTKSCTLAKVLNESDSRDKFDIFERFSLDNFCANIMQLDLDAQLNIDDELTQAIRRMQDSVGKRVFSSLFCPEFVWLLTPGGKRFLEDLTRIQGVIYEIIQKKRATVKENIDYKDDNQKLPLMDMMLEAEGTAFSKEEIFHEIILFLLAATDTSGITLAFTFTLLGMNPMAQEKVYQEVLHHVGVKNPIDHNDLSNLKYTERAIQESMRLLPVVPFFGRRVTADIDLGGRKMPAGSNILISVFDLHRSKTYWADPLEYNPDRFLAEEVASRDPYCFIPFSAGPRNCIGKKYAMMMMKTAVAHVIRKYEVRSNYKSVEDMEFTSCITMKTVQDLDCQFTPRIHHCQKD